MAGGVTAEQIYQSLLANGYSSVQAMGIMANMINESSLDPEAVNPGGPSAGVGLVQWETTFYPAAAGLVTGNPVQDMDNQVRYLAQCAGPHSQATSGTTAAQVAGNFAEYFERCATCNPGGDQYNSRVANAATVESWASSGNWPEGPTPTPASEDPDMSTQSQNGVAAISFRPGTVSQLQITTDPAAGPLQLRVVLSLSTGPWVQNGPGGNAGLYTFDNGYATYNLEASHVAACGGVVLESQEDNRVFSIVGF
jgi:hypothetical protein